MKTLLYCTALLVMLWGCSSDDEIEDPIKMYLSQGEWRISEFVMEQENLTENYTGVVLKFKKNGQVTYTHGTTEVTGQWTQRYEYQGDFIVINYFKLAFTNHAPAEELNHEWELTNVTTLELAGNNSYSNFRLEKIE